MRLFQELHVNNSRRTQALQGWKWGPFVVVTVSRSSLSKVSVVTYSFDKPNVLQYALLDVLLVFNRERTLQSLADRPASCGVTRQTQASCGGNQIVLLTNPTISKQQSTQRQGEADASRKLFCP